jgi:hypothetical protein
VFFKSGPGTLKNRLNNMQEFTLDLSHLDFFLITLPPKVKTEEIRPLISFQLSAQHPGSLEDYDFLYQRASDGDKQFCYVLLAKKEKIAEIKGQSSGQLWPIKIKTQEPILIVLSTQGQGVFLYYDQGVLQDFLRIRRWDAGDWNARGLVKHFQSREIAKVFSRTNTKGDHCPLGTLYDLEQLGFDPFSGSKWLYEEASSKSVSRLRGLLWITAALSITVLFFFFRFSNLRRIEDSLMAQFTLLSETAMQQKRFEQQIQEDLTKIQSFQDEFALSPYEVLGEISRLTPDLRISFIRVEGNNLELRGRVPNALDFRSRLERSALIENIALQQIRKTDGREEFSLQATLSPFAQPFTESLEADSAESPAGGQDD